mmetsp:Transcript_31771/g.92822  ORF Transcript_31771/g.92822 Transcript_31771/m.92822 type:complete len:954 (-) Transcript_31771:113-2974(-)
MSPTPTRRRLHSAVSAAAAWALVEAVLAEGGTKRYVELSGVDHFSANGVYTQEASPSRCWSREGKSSYFLCRTHHGYWALQSWSNKGTSTGYILSKTHTAPSPDYVEEWMSFRKADGGACENFKEDTTCLDNGESRTFPAGGKNVIWEANEDHVVRAENSATSKCVSVLRKGERCRLIEEVDDTSEVGVVKIHIFSLGHVPVQGWILVKAKCRKSPPIDPFKPVSAGEEADSGGGEECKDGRQGPKHIDGGEVATWKALNTVDIRLDRDKSSEVVASLQKDQTCEQTGPWCADDNGEVNMPVLLRIGGAKKGWVTWKASGDAAGPPLTFVGMQGWVLDKDIDVRRRYGPDPHDHTHLDVILKGVNTHPAANGKYMRDDFQSSCYSHADGSAHYICRTPSGHWALQGRENKGSDTGYVISSQSHADEAQDAGPWMDYNKELGEWKMAQYVTVTVIGPVEGGREFDGPHGEPHRRHFSEGGDVTWTVAAMLLGGFVVGMALLSLVHTQDKHIRSYVFKVISSTITILLSIVISTDLWAFIFEQLLSSPRPRGLGIGEHSLIAILVALALFSLCFFGLTVVAWKVQYDPRRVVLIKTLGAHILAFLGILTFLGIQRRIVGEDGDKDRGRAMAIGTAFLAWGAISGLIMADVQLRKQYMAKPPANPWPQKPKKAVTPAPAPPDRSCLMKTAPPPPPSDPLDDDDDDGSWSEAVEHAQVEVQVLVVAFLVNQFCCYLLNGWIPGMHALFMPGDEDRVSFWVWVSVLFFVATAGLFLFRTLKPKLGGHFVAVLEHICMLSLAWGLYRYINWQTHAFLLGRTAALVNVLSALVASLLAVLFIFALDALADQVSKSKGGCFKWMKVNPSSKSVERAIRLVITCWSLVVALAWDKAFECALDVVVEETKYLQDHPIIARFLLAIAFTAFVLHPWRTYILPKAEMSYDEHQKQIDQEKATYRS